MLKGVFEVMPGYAGGTTPNPTYEAVCSGKTGHAEVLRVEFDPKIITYKDLLTVFFATHDPTTLNQQGADVGTQYRSIILYTTDQQKEQAEKFIDELNIDGQEIVTEVKPLEKFYEAEPYHHHYYQNNPEQAYCRVVINPKLEKLKTKFSKLLQS